MTGPFVVDERVRLATGRLPDARLRRAGSSEVRDRLQHLRATLAQFGVDGLGDLGELALSGTLTPRPGLTRPVTARTRRRMPVSGFRAPRTGRGLVGFGGEAEIVDAEALPVRARAVRPGGVGRRRTTQELAVAYWAGTSIDIADDTTVVLTYPHAELVLIADRITVGSRVTITWQRPLLGTPGDVAPGKSLDPRPPAVTPGRPPRAARGRDGSDGGVGASGLDGPRIELWTLDLRGSPVVDVGGQDGGPGGAGGAGGPGADGTEGSPDEREFLVFCTAGPGAGGHGGFGGRGGDGGQGGTGGAGGSLSLFAPQASLTRYLSDYQVTIDGGAGGRGGRAGRGGDGGRAGARGNNANGCTSDPPREAGDPGPDGRDGDDGPDGEPGATGRMATRAITEDEFRVEQTRPAIVALTPAAAAEGDVVTAVGKRFAAGDEVVVDDVPAATTVLGDELLTFTVPDVPGGVRRVRVRRAGPTTSNGAALYVRPTATGISPASAEPGTDVTVTGTGFADGAAVVVDGEDMPDVVVESTHRLRFRLRRPESVEPGADGESVQVRVVLADRGPDSTTGPLSLALRTFLLLVVGDSVGWGQGLVEADKFHSIVERSIRESHGGIGVQKLVRAHSGAIIGLGDTTVEPPLDGEVPTKRPTVLQQVGSLAAELNGRERDVRLVLVGGGFNDVDLTWALMPTTGTDEIAAAVDRRCRQDMAVLLERVAERFPQATIVVTGYYPILSPESDLALVQAVLIALGVAIGITIGTGAVLTTAARSRVVENCTVLHDRSREAIAAAVAQADGGTGRIRFADPGFSARNAALAPDALVFGVDPVISPQDAPEVAGPRAVACAAAPADRTAPGACELASVGHPNRAGAIAYADAITAVLP